MEENIYRKLREQCGFSREEASEKSGDKISDNRLGRIESNQHPIHPSEVLVLAELYKKPTLSNYYCSNECPIGRLYVPEVEPKDLTQIVLEILKSLNTLKQRQELLIDITADGVIADDEIKDFVYIQDELENISLTVETLRFWVEKTIADGKINLDKYRQIKNG